MEGERVKATRKHEKTEKKLTQIYLKSNFKQNE